MIRQFREFGKKIICIGRNYEDHAAELKNVVPSTPLLFCKTANSFLGEGEGKIRRPPGCSVLHHEVELGIVISRSASCIKSHESHNYVAGYVIALDMTARDLQSQLKDKGHPWFIAKSFDTSCPVGEFLQADAVGNGSGLEIYCKVNGVVRQKDTTDAMIFKIPDILEYITKFVTLERGDLVLTGTPAGVGPCQSGDELEIGITNFTKATFHVE